MIRTPPGAKLASAAMGSGAMAPPKHSKLRMEEPQRGRALDQREGRADM